MTATTWLWIAVAATLAVLDWIAIGRSLPQPVGPTERPGSSKQPGLSKPARLTKPAVVAALLVAALASHPQHDRVQMWLVLALLSSLLGDVSRAIWPDPDPAAVPREHAGHGFILGLGCYLVSQVCYSTAMVQYGTDKVSVAFGLALVLLTLFAFGYRLIMGAYTEGGDLLTVVVALYIAAIGSTAVLAVGTTSLWIGYGIVLYAISDLVVGADRFVRPKSWSPMAVAITYHSAQTLLAIGLMR